MIAPVPVKPGARVEIRIGLGSCCQASGSMDVYRAVRRWVEVMRADAVVREGCCVGICHRMPLLEIVQPDGQLAMYGNVIPAMVPDILRRHLRPRGLGRAAFGLRRAWQKLRLNEAWEPLDSHVVQAQAGPAGEFLLPQVRIATADCGRMTPTSLDDYMAHGGYAALEQAVRHMTRQEVIDQVKTAHLRGRGGAGFPSGIKWELVASQHASPKYVVCNGDEGDPGAFMDRMLLEGYPHRVLEGLLIAAYAVGASQAYFYIRQEYPLAVAHVAEAIAQARAAGIVGPKVFGGDFRMEVEIRQGSGAFVCGEETALIASIEGRRGTPRLRPPYPAQHGLAGKPTLVSQRGDLRLRAVDRPSRRRRPSRPSGRPRARAPRSSP